MNYRNEIMADAVNHMLAGAGEFGWWSGHHGMHRKMPFVCRKGTAKFEWAHISVINSTARTQVMAFPCYLNDDKNWITDYTNPLMKWEEEGCHYYFKDGACGRFVDELASRCVNCADPKTEIAYLIAYIER